MKLELDHLVVAAATLEAGAAWCEASFGVTPAPGGRHPLMGTHNRLLRIDSPLFTRAYLEIIAVDPAAPPPGRRRWYDLDDDELQRRLAEGPALIHWVARCADLTAARAEFFAAGADPGEVQPAQRGELRWQITVRPDGRRLAGGALPTLIAWGAAHPCDTLPASGVRLEGLVLRGLPAALHDGLPAGIGPGVEPDDAAPALSAIVAAPRGALRLQSPLPLPLQEDEHVRR